MTKKQRTWLWIGAGAAVLLAGGVAYAQMHKPAVPAGTLPAGSITPVASFSKGQKYTFAAPTPAGITAASDLATALTNAGWSSVTVPYFGGAGTVPAGFTAVSANGYIATGTWGGADGTSVPSGVVAAATP
jgi:hypothetical protein